MSPDVLILRMFAFLQQVMLAHRAMLMLVLVNVLWGASFPIMKYLNLQMDAHFGVTPQTASHTFRVASAGWVIGLRFGMAFMLFLVFLPRVLKRVRPPEAIAGAAIGAFFFFGLLLQVIGLATIPASRSGFLTSLVVVFTPLLSTIMHRQLPRPLVLLGAAVALVGIAVLTGVVEVQRMTVRFAPAAANPWQLGDSLTLLGTLFFTIQILLIDTLGKRLDSILFTPTMFATTSLLALIVFFVLRSAIPETSGSGWSGLASQPSFFILLGLLCLSSLIAFSLMNQFQPLVSASQASVIYTLEPLCASSWAMFTPAMLTALGGVLYANERLSLPLLIGGCLVLAANMLVLWSDRQPSEIPPSADPPS